MEYLLNAAMIEAFKRKLTVDEQSEATIKKYMHDVTAFMKYIGDSHIVTKEIVIQYKQYLIENYAVTSVNSMLAAINRFLKAMGWYDCVVKSFKVQRETFRSREKELTKAEYFRLLRAARQKGNRRLYLIMETICGTGIRVSELRFVTVEALRTGRAKVSLKGKTRTVILPASLCRELERYIREMHIESGSIFVTRNGHPLDRSNILHDMKALCQEAGVDRKKVFPHNLRHLFACTYYQIEKDLSRLADILGHSNINTTRIYTLVSSERQAEQIDRLGLIDGQDISKKTT